MIAQAPAQAARNESQRALVRERPPEPRLAAVKAKDERRRLSRGKARGVAVLASLLIAGTLLLVAAGQAMVASQQVRLDNLTSELQVAVAKNQNLQLSKAQLVAPNRILEIAEHKLGMVLPADVTYLSPVNPGASLGNDKARIP